MTYEPFSLRTRNKVEVMGRLAHSQHVRMENSPHWGRNACSLTDAAERSLWEASWDKAKREHQKEK